MIISQRRALEIATEMADRVEDLIGDELPQQMIHFLTEDDPNDAVNSYSMVYNLTLKILGDRHESSK